MFIQTGIGKFKIKAHKKKKKKKESAVWRGNGVSRHSHQSSVRLAFLCFVIETSLLYQFLFCLYKARKKALGKLWSFDYYFFPVFTEGTFLTVGLWTSPFLQCWGALITVWNSLGAAPQPGCFLTMILFGRLGLLEERSKQRERWRKGGESMRERDCKGAGGHESRITLRSERKEERQKQESMENVSNFHNRE